MMAMNSNLFRRHGRLAETISLYQPILPNGRSHHPRRTFKNEIVTHWQRFGRCRPTEAVVAVTDFASGNRRPSYGRSGSLIASGGPQAAATRDQPYHPALRRPSKRWAWSPARIHGAHCRTYKSNAAGEIARAVFSASYASAVGPSWLS